MTKAKQQRKKHTQEFKHDAVALVTGQSYSISLAVHGLDISDTIFKNW